MTSSRFNGEVVTITGAASGIGRALALLLAGEGALLSLADVNAAALAGVKAEALQRRPDSATDTTIFTAVVDVRSRKSCEEWIQATLSHFGKPLAGAANLAGVIGRSITQEGGSTRNIQDDEFDWVMQVNVNGTLNCMRAELPHMRTGKAGRGGGAIVNAASISGIMGLERNCPYVAAKHSIVGLTRTAAKEEGANAIRVNAIAPGIIATPMLKQIEASAGSTDLIGKGDPGALARKGDPEEVAEAIAFLLSPQSSFISGAVLPIDGGFAC
ncbi:hypothetical protein DL771_004878 [Monosporascus sp. 5C6A]|nr:hypothetical protein DL771_004878 [Monosporascus sp. 5C6A]